MYSNVYTATVPADWVRDPEPVQLIITSGATSESKSCNISLTIVDPSRRDLVFGSIAAAVLGVLLIALLVFVRRSRERMKDLVKSFFKMELRAVVELLVDVWDIYGA